MPLSLGHSGWLLALSVVAAGALTWWAYRRTTPPLSTGRRLLLGGLRFGALAIVLFLLFEPIWRRLDEEETPPAVGVLIDDSESLRVTGRPDSTGADAVPDSATADPAPAVRQALGRLRQDDLAGGRPLFFGFSDRVRRLPDAPAAAPGSLRFDGARTDIAAALQSAREQLQNDNLRALVLVSDGQYNTGRNPLYWAERSPVPIHTVVLGDTARRRDVVVRRALTNDLAYVDAELPVRVGVQAEGYDGERVQVSLWDGEERLDTQSLTLPEGSAEATVDLAFVPESAGLKRLTASVARLDGEATYRNNTQPLTVRVLESKRQVLLLGAAPTPDLSATRRLLDEDSSTEVTARISREPGAFYGGALPDSLGAFDVAVLNGFPGTATSAQDARRVVAALEDGLPALFLLSPQTDLQALQQHFSGVLPAAPQRVRSSAVEAAFVPTPQGRRHPVFDLPPGAPTGAWSRLPPLQANQSRWQPAPDARALATARIRGADTGNPLLLVQQRAGRRSAMLLGAGTWRWVNVPASLEAAAPLWPGLLSNLVQWTSAQQDERPVRVEPERPTFAGGETVRLSGQVYDQNTAPVEGASVEVTLTGPDGQRYPYQMRALGSGRYALDAGTLPAGSYEYEAAAEKDSRALGTDRGSFAVGETTLEFRQTRADAALMRQIAERSGGSFHTATSADALSQQIASVASFEPLVTTTSQETKLWQRYAFLLAALLLLGAEWVLRKRSGMA